MQASTTNEQLRYESDERSPPLLTIGVAVQCIMLILAPMVMTVIITGKATGQGDDYLNWALFAMLIIAGAITAIQSIRLWRLGCGQMVIMGPTIQFVVASAAAVSEGGPALLATVLVVSSLFQFAVAAWLPLLRRIITPVVTGTVLMLIAATLLPIVFDRMIDVPEGTSSASGPAVALVTIALSTLLALRAPGLWRLWSPVICIGIGTLLAAFLGMYSFQRVIDASWVGIPERQLPGFDLSFGVEFWALLPTFAILSLVLAIKVTSDSVIIQTASQREQRAIDFRRVQGTVGANGIGMILSGIAGVPPTMPISATSVSIINLTGVASRAVGFAAAAIFVIIAIFPKLTSILLTIPDPVMGAYLLLIMGMYFVGGVRTVIRDGLDQRKALIAGLAFCAGLGMHHNNILAVALGDNVGSLLGNGVMTGMIVAMLLTAFTEFSGKRRSRLQVELATSSLPALQEFLRTIASNLGWNAASANRLRAAGEETLSSLLMSVDDAESDRPRRLRVSALPGDGSVELEFVASVDDQQNIQDKLAYLEDQTSIPDPSEISLLLLRHYTSSVQHRKYHGVDVVVAQVEGSA